MTTVSSISPTSVYENYAPAKRASGSTGQKSGGETAQPAANLPTAESIFTSLGSNSSSPLTYNATGLLHSFQLATSAKSTSATTSAQAAQNAILAAENVVTQTLNSLTLSSSSNSASSDNSALFGLPGASGANPSELTRDSLSNASTTGSPGTQASYDAAILAAKNVVTETLNSLASNS